MTEYVRAYTGDEGNTLVSVPKAFAEGANLHTVKDAATDIHGRPLPPAEGYRHKKTSAAPATENKETGGGSAASSSEEAE